MSVWHRVIHPITQYFRRRRGQFLLQHFPKIREMRICDLGGSRHYWQKLGIDIPPTNITIYNISASETAGVTSDHNDIEMIIYDGNRIPVVDNAFDLLICNSVLEHVPPDNRATVAREIRRVAPRAFIQTPARAFPIEPHFLMPIVHWMPRGLGYQLIKVSPWRILAKPTVAEIKSYWWGTQLLSRKELRALFPGAAIVTEDVAGLTKSYYVILDAVSRAAPRTDITIGADPIITK